MSDNCKSIEERVDGICKWTNAGLRDAVRTAMHDLACDQRYLCAEAIHEMDSDHDCKVEVDDAYSRVFNARMK